VGTMNRETRQEAAVGIQNWSRVLFGLEARKNSRLLARGQQSKTALRQRKKRDWMGKGQIEENFKAHYLSQHTTTRTKTR